VNEDEYKVMGLAAFGEDTFAPQIEALLSFVDDGAFHFDASFVDLAGLERWSTSALSALLGPPRAPGAPIERRHEDIACSAQARLEAALIRIVDTLPNEWPLCIAGGVGLNAAANGRIGRTRPLYVPFAAGDSGGAIGAALVGHHLALGEPRGHE